MGKYLAPLSLAMLDAPIASLGLSQEALGPGTFAYAAMLVYAATVNTLLVNVLVIPILWWEIRRSRPGRDGTARDRNRPARPGAV